MAGKNWTKTITDNHHAFLLCGDKKSAVRDLVDYFEKEKKLATKGNPDFLIFDYDVFGIDESREISSRHSQKSFGGEGRVFVVSLNFITTEAQNSMLKLFEDPASGVRFFVAVSDKEVILPTLRSRFHIVETNESENLKNAGKKFLSMPLGQRLKFVRKIADDIKNEKASKTEAVAVANGLIEELASDAGKIRQKSKILEELEKCRGYLNDRSPSIKMLLEHIALIVPPAE